MNIFRKYTVRSLLKNKMRTFVTIVGIVLSVAMFTAVTEAVACLRGYLIDDVINSFGGFYANTEEIDASMLSKLKNEDGVDKTVTLGSVGYADIGSQNPYKPYLFVTNMSADFCDLVAVNLESGRLPEREDEIVLPIHLSTNGSVEYSLGDTLTLHIGQRMSDGFRLNQYSMYTDGEKLVGEYEKNYTVVGFYSRFATDIEPYSAPGYTALTVGGESNYYSAFFTLENIRDTFDFISDNPEYGQLNTNSELLMLYGVSGYDNMLAVLIGMAAVLIGLIMFGSVSLIYNSFSISVSERTKQFGILKSIGATKKQIRRTVFYEALFLCIIAVPLGIIAGCAGLGITLYLLRGAFSSTEMFFNTGAGLAPKLIISPTALIIAAAIGVVTTVISAYVPARRAVKVPPIEAVRRSNDITAKQVKIHGNGIVYKLFGFEGMIAAKNFRRNKKQYRTAILSLFMSVVLFVSASSFCRYLTDAAGDVDRSAGYDISYVMHDAYDTDAADRIYKSLSEADGVTESVLLSVNSYEAVVPYDLISRRARQLLFDNSEDSMQPEEPQWEWIYPRIYYVSDAQYEKLARDSGLSVDISDPKALVFDNCKMYINEGDNNLKVYETEYLEHSKITDELKFYSVVEREGYDFFRFEDGFALYLPEDVMMDDSSQIQDEDYLRVEIDEALEAKPLAVAGFVSEKPFFANDDLALIYPRSAIASAPVELYNASMYFLTNDHVRTFNAMTKILSDMNADKSGLFDVAADAERARSLTVIVNVFAYGFIILISLIALTNVFNTVSTNIFLRRRELAMFKSIGMTRRGFNKMMNYECIICGARGLMLGLPVSVLVTFLIYRIMAQGFSSNFYIPWYSIAIAVFSVFAVVFVAMLYSMGKIRKENTIDTLKNENI